MAKGASKPAIVITDGASGSAGGIASGDGGSIAGASIVDPGSIPGVAVGTDGDGNSQPKRRGRKPGSRNKPAQTSQVSVDAIAAALTGIHAIAAAALHVPELELSDKSEADTLALAVSEVAKQYDLGDVAPKTIAWVGLVSVAGKMYGARYFAYRLRLDMERKQGSSV